MGFNSGFKGLKLPSPNLWKNRHSLKWRGRRRRRSVSVYNECFFKL